jgi:hypothetical protein
VLKFSPGNSQQPLTPQEEQQQAAAKLAQQLAQDDLAAAKSQLQNAVAYYDERDRRSRHWPSRSHRCACCPRHSVHLRFGPIKSINALQAYLMSELTVTVDVNFPILQALE